MGGADVVDDEGIIAALARLGVELPFNQHLGVGILEVAPGSCRTVLPENPALANHLGGVHAIAELAPVELAGAIAASSRLTALVARGYVPVVAGLRTTFRAPAHGELTASAAVGEEAVAPALDAADAGLRPRLTVPVEVTDVAGTVVTRAELDIVYLDVADAAAASAAGKP